MKSILTICSEGIVQDRRSNNVTIYNILEEIRSVGFPLLVPRLFFYSWIMREHRDKEETYDLLFEISLDGKGILTQGVPINFRKKPRTRTIVEIGGLPISKAGNLSFKLSYEGKKLGEYFALVMAVDEPNIKVLSDGKTKKQ